MPAIKIYSAVCLLALSCVSTLQAQQPDPHSEHAMEQQLGAVTGEDNASKDPHAGHHMDAPKIEELGDSDLIEDPDVQHELGDTDHGGHNMTLDIDGMAMNGNSSTLPQDCTKVLGEYTFEVYAGTKYATDYPGTIYGMSQHEFLVEPCSSVTIKFINTDSIRHQWMIHGLPRYLYPGGMFHLEAAGGQTREGTFIIPSDDKTYLVHCDMAQHMEMGMKGQLKAGNGSGDLWSIPGVSRSFRPDSYLPKATGNYLFIALLSGVVLAMLIPLMRRKR